MAKKKVTAQHLTLPCTPAWKAEVSRVLKERGRGSRRELAKAIGVSPTLLPKLLGPDVRSSRYVFAISQWAGIDPPFGGEDDEAAAWLAAGRIIRRAAPELYNELREKVAKMARELNEMKSRVKALDDE